MKLIIKLIHSRLEALVRGIKFEFGELGLTEVAEKNNSRKKLSRYNNNNNRKIRHEVPKIYINHPRNI